MDFNAVLPTLIENWPLLFVAAIFWLFGQQVKTFIPESSTSMVWKLFKMTMPLHPVMAGILLGMCSFMPLPSSIKSLGGAVGSLYYAGAGFISVYWHNIWESVRKHTVKEE